MFFPVKACVFEQKKEINRCLQGVVFSPPHHASLYFPAAPWDKILINQCNSIKLVLIFLGDLILPFFFIPSVWPTELFVSYFPFCGWRLESWPNVWDAQWHQAASYKSIFTFYIWSYCDFRSQWICTFLIFVCIVMFVHSPGPTLKFSC